MDARPGGEVRGWVLYDGACGFCSRWIPFWGATLRRRGFHVAPAQAPWVRARTGLPPEALLEDLRLLLADGRLIGGADVYRYLMRRIGWALPLWLLASAPGLRRLFDLGYRVFARNRLRVSRACGLPNRYDPAA